MVVSLWWGVVMWGFLRYHQKWLLLFICLLFPSCYATSFSNASGCFPWVDVAMMLFLVFPDPLGPDGPSPASLLPLSLS